MLKTFVFTFCLGALFVSALSSVAISQQSVRPATERPLQFEELLQKIGDNYDCFFTIEAGVVSGDSAHSLIGRFEFSEPTGKSIHDVLDALRKSVPNFSYRINAENSRIFHIIDKRLENDPSYSMNRLINEITFEGSVVDLVNVVRRAGVNISSLGPSSSTEAVIVNLPTKVQIVAKKKTVRSILTNYLALNNQRRVLWKSKTELATGQPTVIRYLQ